MFFYILLYNLTSYIIEQNKNIMKVLLPFHLNKVGAGFPSPATDYIENDINLNVHLIKNIPSTFLIRVQGKSMNNVGIHDGDLLIVDKSLNPKKFSTVIVNINEELVVKTFIKEKDQSFLTSGSKEIKDKKLTIHGYGASTKGNVLLQFYNIDNKDVSYIADRNPLKYNLFTPGTKIKIISENNSRKLRPEYYLVLPWHFKKEILLRENFIRKKGTKFIFPLPEVKVV